MVCVTAWRGARREPPEKLDPGTELSADSSIGAGSICEGRGRKIVATGGRGAGGGHGGVGVGPAGGGRRGRGGGGGACCRGAGRPAGALRRPGAAPPRPAGDLPPRAAQPRVPRRGGGGLRLGGQAAGELPLPHGVRRERRGGEAEAAPGREEGDLRQAFQARAFR